MLGKGALEPIDRLRVLRAREINARDFRPHRRRQAG